jgi:circadian clock protein KaiC
VKKRTGPHENTLREFSIDSSGLKIGQPLDQFQGILRGVPQILGTGPSGMANLDE